LYLTEYRRSKTLLWYVILIVRESAQGPATPNSTPSDGTFCPDAPIQFDLTTPGTASPLKPGPPKYVNEISNSRDDGDDINAVFVLITAAAKTVLILLS